MTLKEAIKVIEEVASRQPSINMIVENDVFRLNAKADAYCLDLQNFLLRNRSDYPELTDNCCHNIKSNLHSAASCGIFLGGSRGKTIRRG